MKSYKCDCNVVDSDLVESVKDKLPDEEVLYDLSELFKVFGDSTRIKIICALLESEMCVCDIANTIDMSHSAVSHQLRILRVSKLVKATKKGKIVYYKLDDDHVKKIFDQGYAHIIHLRK